MKCVFYAWVLLCLIQRIQGRDIPHPIKALYIDYKGVDWAHPELTVLNSANGGWNVIILSFYVSTYGPADMAQYWQSVASVTKQAVMNSIHAKGGVVLVSLGGATDSPFEKDPVQLGHEVATWAVNNYLDGIDFDLENFAQGFTYKPKDAPAWSADKTIQWVADLTNAAREILGPDRIISHAPQSPYFGPRGATNTWAGKAGGYVGVYQKAPSIDFFNVQFYNQAPGCYLDYEGLFQMSCPSLPLTAVKEIVQAGIPMDKLVVGKYINASDASNGWIAPTLLNQYVSQAQRDLGWRTGVMAWAWGNSAEVEEWITTVYPIGCY